MAIYSSTITSDTLVAQFEDEVAKEILVPASTIIDASVPEFQTSASETADDVYGTLDGVVPSGIPSAIDKLWKYHNNVPDIDPPVSPVLKLKNTMNDDYNLTGNFNGICIDLDTTGHNLRIDSGSVLIAL